MKTRRQLIQLIPATTLSRLLPLAGLSATAGLLSACGEKATTTAVPSASPAPAPAPAEAPAAAPAAPAPVAATGPLVDEKDAQATALGYVSDATKADKAKYANYAAGQNCSNCALYQGAAGSAQGGCPLFAGKQVSAQAWCSAYAKKTG